MLPACEVFKDETIAAIDCMTEHGDMSKSELATADRGTRSHVDRDLSFSPRILRLRLAVWAM